MKILLRQFGNDIALVAQGDGLYLTSVNGVDWTRPETWPTDALGQSAGRRTSFEAASLLEMGLATSNDGALRISQRLKRKSSG